ncbi:MAG: hypothetical protein D6732_18655 [Methanobacteriota archaeon]|nr:MAG: hypothetical protein D6732_18655 [Euryarchaeota archaeon]
MERQIELQILKTRRMQYLRGILLALGIVSILIATAFVIDYYVTTTPTGDDNQGTPSHQSPLTNDTDLSTNGTNDEPISRISLLAEQVRQNYEKAVYMRVNFNYTDLSNDTSARGWNKDIHLIRINSTTWFAYVWFANFSNGYPEDLRIYNYSAYYSDLDIQQINGLLTDSLNRTEEVEWDWSSWDWNSGGGNIAYFLDIFYENGSGIEFHLSQNFDGDGIIIYTDYLWNSTYMFSYPWGDFPLPQIRYPYSPLYLSPVSAFDTLVTKIHELFSDAPPG